MKTSVAAFLYLIIHLEGWVAVMYVNLRVVHTIAVLLSCPRVMVQVDY